MRAGRRWMLAGLLVLLVSAAWMWRAAARADGLVVHEGLTYCTGGGQPLLMDVVEPEARAAPRPALLFVHGGGWQGGSRRDYRELMQGLARQGAVGFSVDYRLAPAAAFPAQIEDVKCAVRWIRAHADVYALDTRHLVAIGGSAGAHLVALLGTTAGRPELEGTGGFASQPSHISAMVLHGGVYDLAQAFADPALDAGARRSILALLGARPAEDPARYAAASPVNFVARGSARALLIHGDHDPLVPAAQAVRMHEALTAAGGRSQLVIVRGGGHGDFGTGAETERVLQAFKGFLAEAWREP